MSEEGLQEHDRVHILLHEFLGGETKAAEWMGEGKKTPTMAEEMLVNFIHRNVDQVPITKRLSDEELRWSLGNEIEAGLMMGFIKPESKYFKNGEPNVDLFIKKVREMENTPGFDLLVEAAQKASPFNVTAQ